MASARQFGSKKVNDNLHDSVQGTVSGPPPQLYQPEFQKQLIEQQKQPQAHLEHQKKQQQQHHMEVLKATETLQEDQLGISLLNQ